MNQDWSRRVFIGTMGASLVAGRASAQSGNGLLEKLRQAKLVKVGIVNSPPYSSLNPDGTLDGVAPAVAGLCLARIGIPKMEASIAPYAQLIPGLMAGRWDMIAASLSISQERCKQVTYSDPITFTHDAAFAYRPGDLPNPPRGFKEIGQTKLKVGVQVGSYTIPLLMAAQSGSGNVAQFPDASSVMEALFTKRIDIGFSGVQIFRKMQAEGNKAFEFVHPLNDDMPHGAGLAFRPGDTDLIDAIQREYRAMKKSGEAEKIVKQYGFDVPPGALEITNVRACEIAPN